MTPKRPPFEIIDKKAVKPELSDAQRERIDATLAAQAVESTVPAMHDEPSGPNRPTRFRGLATRDPNGDMPVDDSEVYSQGSDWTNKG